MSSPTSVLSPTFKHLKYTSPIDLKVKMRKTYKDKVQNCRNLLINKFRGMVVESDVHNTLTEIYKSMFNYSDTHVDEEEVELLEEIKNELIQEEFQWWLEEYEKSQADDIDWSSIENEDNVICPVCEKNNFVLQNGNLLCSLCQSVIKTQKSLLDIRHTIMSSIEKHNMVCSNEVQFTVVPELNNTHIYLICGSCMKMELVV